MLLLLLLLLSLFFVCLFFLQQQQEGIEDQCHPDTCNAFIGHVYSGYGQSLVADSDDPAAAQQNAELVNFCRSVNGGQSIVGVNQPNYKLDPSTLTFTCMNPFRPNQPLTSVDAVYTVTSMYDSTKTFNNVADATAYCSGINGLGSPFIQDATGLKPNFIVDSDNLVGCRSQFDSSVTMTSIDASNAVWRVDPTSVSVANVDELKQKCKSMNGGRAAMTNLDGSDLPLYKITSSSPAVLFDCNSYWTGAPIENTQINEQVIYNAVTDVSFTTHEDKAAYCKKFGSEQTSLTAGNNAWKFNCISDITGQDMTADQYKNDGNVAYKYSPDISFNSMDKVKEFCGATDPVLDGNTFKCGDYPISFAYQITPTSDSGDVQLPTFTSYDDMVTFTQKFGLKPKILNPEPNATIHPNPTFTIDGSFCSAYDSTKCVQDDMSMKKFCIDNGYATFESVLYRNTPQTDPMGDATMVFNYFLQPSTDNYNLAKDTDRKFYCRNSNYNLLNENGLGFVDPTGAYFSKAKPPG
jgi:hypothetical protein